MKSIAPAVLPRRISLQVKMQERCGWKRRSGQRRKRRNSGPTAEQPPWSARCASTGPAAAAGTTAAGRGPVRGFAEPAGPGDGATMRQWRKERDAIGWRAGEKNWRLDGQGRSIKAHCGPAFVRRRSESQRRCCHVSVTRMVTQMRDSDT